MASNPESFFDLSKTTNNDPTLDWIEDNLNSIITTKQNDSMSELIEDTGSSFFQQNTTLISQNAYFNNVLFDQATVSSTERLRKFFATPLLDELTNSQAYKRIFSPEKIGTAQTPNTVKTVDFNAMYDKPQYMSPNAIDDPNDYANASKELIVLHVKHLDYKIQSDEWHRILMDTLKKHCKEV
jgi:hypothetical protein